MSTANSEPYIDLLQSVVCVDRMCLYNDVTALFVQLQRGSILEDLNTTIYMHSSLSASELVELLHNSMVAHLTAIAAEFDVVVEGATLSFLYRFVNALNLLDAWAEHEYVINVVMTSVGEPHHKLLQALNIIETFDEEEYYSCVKMASLSLIDAIVSVHQKALDFEESESVIEEISDTTPLDPTILRKIVKGNRGLIISRLFEEGLISDFLPAKSIISLAYDYFADMDTVEPKDLSAELIGLFAATGAVGADLIKIVTENAQLLINNDALLSRMGIVINTVYSDMTK